MAPATAKAADRFVQFFGFVFHTISNRVGHDVAGNRHRYIPWKMLRDYWTAVEIHALLYDNFELHVDVGVVQEQYLRIFSTLVFGGPSAVQHFKELFINYGITDEKLPLLERPGAWMGIDCWIDDYCAGLSPNQWQFFPLPFDRDHLQDCDIGPGRILPIDPPVQLWQGGCAVVKRIVVHDDHQHLAKRCFVLKTYDELSESLYKRELEAYRRLNHQPSANLLQFFGSFRQLGSCSLVLEYVDGGNLEEFLDKTPPPTTSEDVAMFWANLFKALNGLDRIHQIVPYEDGEVIMGYVEILSVSEVD